MKNIVILTVTSALVLFFSGCSQEISTPNVGAKTVKKAQVRDDVRIFTTQNSEKITKESIEAAFKANGFMISGNNDMNQAFKGRFGKKIPTAGTDYSMYRLMFVYNAKLSAKLIKDYPAFGLLSPLSTSVFSKDGKTINISSLSIEGMSRISGVPVSNPNLIALSNNMTKALKEALPSGSFKDLNYKIVRPDGEIVTKFKFVMNNESNNIEESKETYQEMMEGEIESNGFIVAGFTPINEDLESNGIKDFDFYDTYSICKLEVIYPVHKKYPEVGALAPCTMYMYKKKDEKVTHMAYPSVYNWVMTTNIEDESSLEPLIDAQNLLESTIDSTIE
ncbi:MAG: DUF302 domain-containing protein [Campylobacteraceae bacterium]|jgi:uncharacterized protein (DUF302 family)|nr:DUF302 domain-containing protein [Campylobacteraceae bacterium]MBT3881997.1 DUF302 domain-containing protein [Campylobacteraceae bacterium]MBT4030001.1 DUF302 domain-containing protein [Campylobacteraceae bacterium]MBT4179961.1 DUF302 domain-containing protein [Campylobacteraceae bacterium]MBT4572265.1 DUF302 domain-containing protein [Campylobacteraceae bacterium]